MFDVIIAANGISARMGFDKLSANLGDATVLNRTVNAFRSIPEIDKIIVVGGNAVELDGVVKVRGGATRFESVFNGLKVATATNILVHDGARPFVSYDLIKRVCDATIRHGSAVPCVKSADSIRRVNDGKIVESIDRETCLLVQTPQGFATDKLKEAFAKAVAEKKNYTDESEIYTEFAEPCHTVDGDVNNVKITTAKDLFGINARIGTGFDVHRFETSGNKPLKLCGIAVAHSDGLLAHSDGDVALHALMDALLTSVGERDIGVHFPDTDESYRGADSAELLKRVLFIVREANAEIVSVNLTIIAQKPKLSPYIEKMRQSLAALLQVSSEKISVSATTTENLGLIGDGKAIAAIAAVTVN